MLDIQLLPMISKKQFKAVILVNGHAGESITGKESASRKSACERINVSAIARLKGGCEIVFLPAPEKERISFAYAEQTSRFVHKLENGIYAIQSKNARLKNAESIEIIVCVCRKGPDNGRQKDLSKDSAGAQSRVAKKRFELAQAP